MTEKSNGHEVDAEEVINELLKRISQVELDNATLRAILNQSITTVKSTSKEGE